MTVKPSPAAALALALAASALAAGAAQAHCGHKSARHHVRPASYRLYGAPHGVVRSSFVERRTVYGPAMQPVAFRTVEPVPVYDEPPEITADGAIMVARHHGLAKLKSAEHHGGHWNVDGWAFDGRWLEAQVYGDGRLKRINIQDW